MIIGITGTIGSGKGTVVEYLVEKKGFIHAPVSEFLASEARKKGIFPDRIARRDVANEYRAKGPMALMEAVYASVEEASTNGQNIVLEPQHTTGEVAFIQSKGGIEFAVDADLKTRYDRISKRGTEKDFVTFEEFEKEQTHEMASDDPNKNNLAAAIAKADYRFTNNGSQEELFAQVELALSKAGV
jgi:dephospho-CoA kinase